jgi:hypothetical protein
VETTEQKGERRENLQRPEPEEQKGYLQHQHCPPAKHREDRNTKYHEEQHKDVAGILAAPPPKKTSKGNISRSTNKMLHAHIYVFYKANQKRCIVV